MTYFEKNEQKSFFPMFSMLNAIGEISKVADFTTPCGNIADSAVTQLSCAVVRRRAQPKHMRSCNTSRWDTQLQGPVVRGQWSIWAGAA